MKTIFKSIALIAAVAVTFAACSKVEEQQIEQTPLDAEKEYVYTFALGNSPDTKAILGTDANGRFVEWTSGDQLGSITTKSQGFSNITPAEGATPATFAIYSSGGLAEGNTINVWFPYRGTYSDATAVPLLIPKEQEQRSDDNKFDFAAMPMVAKQVTVTPEMATSSSTSPIATIDMICLGSTINFKVFSSEPSYASEKVRRITFNARNSDDSADAYIAGSFTKNLTTVDPAVLSTLTIPSFTTGYSSVVTSPRSASSIGTDKASALDLYMVVAPGSYRGTVVVETDAATYTYNLTSAKELVRAGFKAFGLDLKKAASRGLPVDYVTLPWESAEEGEGVSSASLDDVVGVTVNSGSDYSSPYYIRFDNSAHYITIKTDSEIGAVSMAVKQNGSNTSELIVYESSNGSTWSEVERFTLDTQVFTTTEEFASTSRYVKIGFNKVAGNAGLGRIYISKPNTTPRIVADPIEVSALGATNALASYETRNFEGPDDVSVKGYTGCVTAATIEGGKIKYSVDTNYGTASIAGTITLQSAEASDKVVSVTQLGNTLSQSGATGDPLTLTIPDNTTTVTLSITSSVFGWNAAVTPEEGKDLTIKTGDETYASSHSGSANADAQIITLSSTTAAEASVQDLGTLVIYRNGNSSDSQKIEITIKKSQTGGTKYSRKWTASNGAIAGKTSGTIDDEDYDWSFTRSSVVYTGFTSSCIQLGSGSGSETFTLRTSAYPGTIESVYVECSSYSAKHTISITVGGNTYLAATTTPSWTTVGSKGGTGTSSGEIVITFTPGSSARAVYIKSITVNFVN